MTENKKIAMVVGEFPKISESFIVHKFTGLLREGSDVHIVCHKKNEKMWEHFPILKENPEYLKRVHTPPSSERKVLAAVSYPFVLLRALMKAPVKTLEYFVSGFKESGFSIFLKFYQDSVFIVLNPALIHFEFGALAVERTHLKKVLKAKLSAGFRGYDLNFSGTGNKNYYTKLWESADGLHFLGNDLWMRAQKRGCPPDKKRALIPPAVDCEFFKPEKDRTESSGGGIRILSVGRLEWKKGYEFGLQALSLLKQRGINFTYRVIGDGEYLEALAFCRHQLGLEKETEFLGVLDQIQILEHLKSADLLIHSAVSEGFCNAVLEAQAMEIPVVCSDAGGLPENIENGVTGFVVPRRDPAAMADKIEILACDGEMRRRMGKKGRERALKLFNAQDQIKSFSRFYSEIFKNEI